MHFNKLINNMISNRKLLVALMLLMIMSFNCQMHTVMGSILTAKNKTAAFTSHCVVVLDNSATEFRELGSKWVSHQDPCAIHSCEADEQGLAREKISKENCEQFYCDVDSELRSQEGTCCGVCVRNKCHFNNTLYEVGQRWYNKKDCTMQECVQLPNGTPIVNTHTKTCPPLSPDCPASQIYIEDCCRYCFTGSAQMSRGIYSEMEDIWTEEYYANHPCVRECQSNAPAMTCQYTFVVEWYQTMSKACYDCPKNASDCSRPHCIMGDGIPRSVTVVNRMMPGPSIEVCENDLIVVDVSNALLGESTSIHWHGMHQRDTPYMDGVPHISQCPISPHSTFRYTFKAENPGTHFWHSHTGMQRGDGVFGALIIRKPKSQEPHAKLYDFDLVEHKMLVQDWVHEPGVSTFADHHHSRGDNKPRNVLINGMGRYYKAIWDAAKKEARSHVVASATTTRATTTSTTSAPTSRTTTFDSSTAMDNLPTPVPEIEVNSVSESSTTTENLNEQVDLIQTTSKRLHLRNTNELSRLVRVTKSNYSSEAKQQSTTTTEKLTVDTTASNLTQTRSKRQAGDYDISLAAIPHKVYNVRQGFRYRFRIINAEFLNCPITISIDNHTLLTFNSDGYDFEPVEVGSIVTYAGERFDFVVNANQSVGNYWIRLKGLMDCSEQFTSAFQVAILRYDGASVEEEPKASLGYFYDMPGIELNAMNVGSGQENTLTIAELKGLPYHDKMLGVSEHALKPVADYKFFVYYDFYAKDNPVYHPGDLYGINANLTTSNRLFTPQLNHISLKFPSVALLPARHEIDDSYFCNETSLEQQGRDCRKEFCKCHHVLQVPLNSVVELIVVDEGFQYDANHPFHLHGNAFRVVGLERLGSNVTIEMVKQLDRYNLLKRNLKNPPVKDTVTIPDGGYTIIRFEAYNPGFWLFHCHIEFHAEIGMALILKVGDNDEMKPVPKNFPTCHDYMPDVNDAAPDAETTKVDAQTTMTTEAPPNRDGGANKSVSLNYGLLGLMLLTSMHK